MKLGCTLILITLAGGLATSALAQTPLIEKQRNDADYRQRQYLDQARADAIAAAARAQAEDNARRRAADLAHQQSIDAAHRQQLEYQEKRFRSDQPQPNLVRPY